MRRPRLQTRGVGGTLSPAVRFLTSWEARAAAVARPKCECLPATDRVCALLCGGRCALQSQADIRSDAVFRPVLLSRLSHCCASDGCSVSNPRSLKVPQFEVVKPSPPSKCDGSCVGTGACTADRSARCPLRPTRTPQYAGPRVSFPGILESGAGSDAQNPRGVSTARVLALRSVASLTTRRICTADPAHLPRVAGFECRSSACQDCAGSNSQNPRLLDKSAGLRC